MVPLNDVFCYADTILKKKMTWTTIRTRRTSLVQVFVLYWKTESTNVKKSKCNNLRSVWILNSDTNCRQRCNIVFVVLHILSVYLALVIQHEKRMRSVILSPVFCQVLPHFFTLSHKRNNSLKKVIEYKMRVLIFSTTSSKNFSF
jgi:hypothetical protein